MSRALATDSSNNRLTDTQKQGSRAVGHYEQGRDGCASALEEASALNQVATNLAVRGSSLFLGGFLGDTLNAGVHCHAAEEFA